MGCWLVLSGVPLRVFDVFPFFNELDLLELRMDELRPVVDVFGAVELPVTFTGKPKPMNLGAREDMRVHTPAAHPVGPHPVVDWFQRRQTAKLFVDAAPDDIIMLSDVDEIPNRETVRKVIAEGLDFPVTLMMDLYYHRVDLKDPVPWAGTVIAPRRCLGTDPDMQELRQNRWNFPIIAAGGWHFSWLGTPEQVREKLRAVDIDRESAIYGSDGIVAPPEDEEYLRRCVETGADLFGRAARPKQHVKIVPGVLQPHGVVPWLERHPQYARAA